MLGLQQTKINNDATVYNYEIIVDGEVIGICQLRLRPSKSAEMPDGFENHIFYKINSKYYGKGYATEALRLLLIEAKRVGLAEVVINVADDNIASQKVAEKNGAVLVDKQWTTETTPQLMRKYVVKL